ncbi:hypothetical protein DPMN_191510 [Dreissena polymorpha]|uniref:Uncharacterized protein n=1 Tax=Dreissena polymorpha TaxID=45954 RepID=A0A9D3Y3B6_DREPO|nr:hypothetical protein DPMN_191510 [Dreissena polymorpha]
MQVREFETLADRGLVESDYDRIADAVCFQVNMMTLRLSQKRTFSLTSLRAPLEARTMVT